MQDYPLNWTQGEFLGAGHFSKVLLYHPNNLGHANPWFLLIKRKSVKMIGTSAVGRKFVNCKELLITTKFNCVFGLQNRSRLLSYTYLINRVKDILLLQIGGLSSKPSNENALMRGGQLRCTDNVRTHSSRRPCLQDKHLLFDTARLQEPKFKRMP